MTADLSAALARIEGLAANATDRGPTQACRVCGDSETCREWDRGFPPDAAKRRLAKRCKARGHACDPRYLAGGAPELMRALGLDEGEQ